MTGDTLLSPILQRSYQSMIFWSRSRHGVEPQVAVITVLAKNTSNTAFHYTGRLKVKFMIQQFQKDHEDNHYAAANTRESMQLK